MNFARFLISRVFLINLTVALVLGASGFWVTFRVLAMYTKHDETITLPDLQGLSIEQMEKILENKKLKYKITDSATYKINIKPFTILGQDPKPMAVVKENRTIYLTVNAKNPPKVVMPNLVSKSMTQAERILSSLDLRIGELIYKPDLALNSVIEQQIGGEPVEVGSEIYKGSEIDLVLGDGLGDIQVSIPHLYGLELSEARFMLQGSSLNIGVIMFDEDITDSTTALVYKQIPPYYKNATLRLGESVDIWLSHNTENKPEFNPDAEGGEGIEKL